MLPAHRVIGHKEYAAGRKSDPVYDMNWRRARVAAFTPRSLEDDVSWSENIPQKGGLGPAPASTWLQDTLIGVVGIGNRLTALDKDLRGDLAAKQKLLEASAQREAGLLAALNSLSKAVATGSGVDADALRAVIREEMANVVDVQVTVRDGSAATTG